MGISKRDMLMGLMHSAEQGKKLREGTDLANKRLNEGDLPTSNRLFTAGQPKRGQAVDYATDDGNPVSMFLRPVDPGSVVPMTTQLSRRDFQRGTLIAPGRNKTGPESQVGFGSQGVNRVSPDAISPEEAASANPNADLRSKIAAGDAAATEEQRRRDRSEAQMNAARNESNASHRGRVILETLNSLLFQR